MYKFEKSYSQLREGIIVQLKNEYKIAIDKAGKDDKVFSWRVYSNKKQTEFSELHKENGWVLNSKVKDQRRLDKDLSFDTAIKDLLPASTEEEIFEKVEAMAKFDAWQYFVVWLYDDFDNISKSAEPESSNENHTKEKNPFEWTNMSQRDFIKITCAIHFTGKINHGSGNYVKTVEYLAKCLSFPLSEKWQSNLGKIDGYSNAGYNPTQIFDDLKDAFSRNFLAKE